MIKGNTTSGFPFELSEEKVDDWEFLEILRAIDKGNEGLLVDMAETLLGTEQLEALKKHVKERVGRISISGMMEELYDILHSSDELKN